MKILICGGPGVGKSSFLQRLTDDFALCQNHVSVAASKAVLRVDFAEGGTVHTHLWEIASEMIREPHFTCENYFCDVDAAILIVDAGNLDSLKDVDNWLCLLKSHKGTVAVPKYLVVNKADCLKKVITSDHIDLFTRSEGVHDWFYTVGASEFCDYDHKRGSLSRQSSPIDILRKLISLIKQVNNVTINENIPNHQLHLIPTPHPVISLISLYFVASSIRPHSMSECIQGIDGRLLVVQEYPNRSISCHSAYFPSTGSMLSDRKPPYFKSISGVTGSTIFDDSWPFDATSIDRKDSEVLLNGFPDGTFLIRRIHVNELRISIKESKIRIIHTPIRRTHTCGIRDTIRCGRTELRGLEFDSLSTLLDSLRLIQSQCLVLI